MLINVFSPAWFLMFGIDAVLIIVLSIWLRKKTVDQKGKVMTVIGVVNCIIWVVYKFLLSRDPGFDFVLAMELPLQLCNLNMILLVIAINIRKTGLLNFCYCFGIMGALLSLMSPDPEFLNITMLNYNRIGYWVTHHLLIVQSVLIVSSGFYRPKYREVYKSIIILLIMYFGMFFVNLLLRRITGIPVNYLYTFGMPGNTIIEMLYKLIPVYPIYLFPALVVVTPLLYGLVALGRLGRECPDSVHS